MKRFLFLLFFIFIATTHTSDPRDAARKRNNAQLLTLARNGDVAGIIILLAPRGANVLEQDPKTGNTALHYLALLSHKPRTDEAIEAVLSKGGNPRKTNLLGQTPADLAENLKIKNMLAF